MISIVMPTKDCPDNIDCQIKWLEAQSYRDFELIISDSSKDEIRESLEDIIRKANFPVTIIDFPKIDWNQSAKRNRSIEIAKGDIIFLNDADTFLLPDCLASHAEYYKGGGVNPRVVWGKVYDMGRNVDAKEIIWDINIDDPRIIDIKYPEPYSMDYCITRNVSLHKSVFNFTGYFDETFAGNYGQDDIYFFRILRYKFPEIPRIFSPFCRAADINIYSNEYISKARDVIPNQRLLLEKLIEMRPTVAKNQGILGTMDSEIDRLQKMLGTK